MKANVKWIENISFLAVSGSGHAVLMDGAPEYGGNNHGPRPMEMLLMGTAGCTSVDVVNILKKSRVEVQSCEVEITAERAETEPKVFTKINLHFKVKGKNLKSEQVERAVTLSAEKYCSASIMLGKTAEITHSIEIEAL
ncbi:OsmC family protein [Burkholderiaceae bacterium DAT-1]|nr:OsmC family protein [Burkholderiaceae bacterium DAT-1]